MKLCYMYDDNFKQLTSKFLSSIKDKENFDLIDINIDSPVFSDDYPEHLKYGGGIDIWKSRLIHIINIIDSCNENEHFLFSDVDIVLYKPLMPELNVVIKDHDIIFLREIFDGIHPQGGNINFGFNLIRANQKTRRFFVDIFDKVKNEGAWEQQLINQTLYNYNSYDLNWTLFPPEFFSRSIGLEHLNKNIVLYHANCAVTTEKKLTHMEEVDQIISQFH